MVCLNKKVTLFSFFDVMKRFLLLMALSILSVGAMYAQSEASFPGGQDAMNEYIQQNIHYPQDAINNMIEGTVVVTFDVEADGSLKNVKVLRPLDPDLEAEAVRVVMSMPAWTPATDATGKQVMQHVEIPVKFRLPL